jgi:hypothetical protein
MEHETSIGVVCAGWLFLNIYTPLFRTRHSTLVTEPFRITGLLASYSAANE